MPCKCPKWPFLVAAVSPRMKRQRNPTFLPPVRCCRVPSWVILGLLDPVRHLHCCPILGPLGYTSEQNVGFCLPHFPLSDYLERHVYQSITAGVSQGSTQVCKVAEQVERGLIPALVPSLVDLRQCLQLVFLKFNGCQSPFKYIPGQPIHFSV